ncbi:MAG: hypothetical protein NUV77_21105 [Thermoguttaceae bacterium]|nr:hypothetical protein [Thermoguttaceae bacterium]
MFSEIARCTALLFTLFCVGCTEMPESDPRYCDRSRFLPVWVIEVDPSVSEEERKDLDRDRGIEKMLVIPVYRNYRHAAGIDRIAIAHPFLYRPGEEIERKLDSFGQRDKLARLVLWVRGYFPNGLGGNFMWSPVVKGRRMIVKELQQCMGSEDAEISAAMKELLDFKYNAAEVVRSVGYDSRFFQYGYSARAHLLWACDEGTRIVNRLSAEDKKMVAAFAAEEPAKKGKSEPKLLDGTYTCELMSLVFEHGKCFCIETTTNQRAETKYLIKGDKLYIAPILPEGKKMIRNAWPVYTIKGDTLESSHVEDMDTGEIFEDHLPKLILKKQ